MPCTSAVHVRLRLQFGPEAPAAARCAVKHLLSDHGCDRDVVHKVLLVVSELVTNAVIHATPPVDLHLQIYEQACGPDRMHVSVTDGGPHQRSGSAASEPLGEHGRGCSIVSELAEQMGVEQWPDHAQPLVSHWATVELRR